MFLWQSIYLQQIFSVKDAKLKKKFLMAQKLFTALN